MTGLDIRGPGCPFFGKVSCGVLPCSSHLPWQLVLWTVWFLCTVAVAAYFPCSTGLCVFLVWALCSLGMPGFGRGAPYVRGALLFLPRAGSGFVWSGDAGVVPGPPACVACLGLLRGVRLLVSSVLGAAVFCCSWVWNFCCIVPGFCGFLGVVLGFPCCALLGSRGLPWRVFWPWLYGLSSVSCACIFGCSLLRWVLATAFSLGLASPVSWFRRQAARSVVAPAAAPFLLVVSAW